MYWARLNNFRQRLPSMDQFEALSTACFTQWAGLNNFGQHVWFNRQAWKTLDNTNHVMGKVEQLLLDFAIPWTNLNNFRQHMPSDGPAWTIFDSTCHPMVQLEQLPTAHVIQWALLNNFRQHVSFNGPAWETFDSTCHLICQLEQNWTSWRSNGLDRTTLDSLCHPMDKLAPLSTARLTQWAD